MAQAFRAPELRVSIDLVRNETAELAGYILPGTHFAERPDLPLAVITRAGALEVPVALSADLMPGAVALPHGWGHQGATGLSVASKTRGVNANLLAADGPDAIEPLSGMAQFNGIAVRISAVANGAVARAAT